jgi:glycosyltransferase involved in cell wall biosynthesis
VPGTTSEDAAGSTQNQSGRPALVRVLVVTADVIGQRMAGPAIRAWQMAGALAAVADVKLVSTARVSRESERFPVEFAADHDLKRHEQWADVIVFQGHLLAVHPWLKASTKIFVVDIYDPMHLEQLEQTKNSLPKSRLDDVRSTLGVINDQIMRADFLMCASEKQRDFWLGQLAAVGRINPATYDADESLRNLLSVVPFGVENEPPVQQSHGIKGTVPGIAPDDKVIIWGGGIYNWFDPVTLIHAVAKVSATRSNVRLFFLGVKHPNPHVPAMSMAFEARELAKELGLLDTVVFFNDGWVPYDTRADYLLDADLGVSTHLDHLETAFSFRTRILDYLWAGLPIVSTDGDTFADIVRVNKLGTVVPPQDVDALASALDKLLYDEETRQQTSKRVTAFSQSMTWEKVLQPLVEFCSTPHVASDHNAPMELPQARQIRDLRTRIRGLESSTSWKITRPIRLVSEGVRRALGKPPSAH